jgi:N-acetylglucosaminyl-diphospho-decaprenol L-rhamnosyltransferase
MSQLAVVTVVHDSADDLERLLTSLDRFARPAPRVIVVDSGSRDRGPDVARRSGAELVTLPGNLGFGAGCNAGMARVEEPVTALLNPDVELLDGGLAKIAREASQRDALFVPRLLNSDGSVQDSAHPKPGTVEALLPALVPKPLLPSALRRRYEPWRSAKPRRVGWAIAACVVARTDLLRRLGPFDQTAFLFYEDLDLCLRAHDAGVPTILRPDVVLRHRGGTSVDRALAGRTLELKAKRRRAVMAGRGRGPLLLDDASEWLTYATRAIGRTVLRRGGEYERAQLRALSAARRQRPARAPDRRADPS